MDGRRESNSRSQLGKLRNVLAHLVLWSVRQFETPRVPKNAIERSSEAANISSSGRVDSGIPLWGVRSVDRCSQQPVLDASKHRFVGALAAGSIHRWLLDVESTQGSRYGSLCDVPFHSRVRVNDYQSNGRHALRTGANTLLRHVEPTEFRSAGSHSPSAPPTCWVVLRRAEAKLASCGSTPETAVNVNRTNDGPIPNDTISNGTTIVP